MSIDYPKVMERQLEAIRDLQKQLKYYEQAYADVLVRMAELGPFLSSFKVFREGQFWKIDSSLKLTKTQPPVLFKRRYKKRGAK